MQISEALVSRKSCFLDDEGWRQIQSAESNSALMPKNSALYHEGLNYFATVPGLLQKANALDPEIDPERAMIIRLAADQLRTDMMAWYARVGVVSKRSLQSTKSDDNWSVLPVEYVYDDSITASFAVNYSAYLILINNLLDELAGSASHSEENKALATEISLSASYCSKIGFCGTQAMSLALPVALIALPQKDLVGVRKWIDFFKQSNQSTKLWATILEKK